MTVAMMQPTPYMAKMADNVKMFYATLTPEQQAAFDKMHMSHMGYMSHKIRTSQM